MDPLWIAGYVSIKEEDIGENEHTKGESSGTWKEREWGRERERELVYKYI